MVIYTDRERSKKADLNIVENQTYIIDFEDANLEQIEAEIKGSKLSDFISWHPGNKIGVLKIINYIGNIYIFGKTINVRSNKFLNEYSGDVQFKKILDEIILLSNNIIFSYNSPSFAIREKNQEDNNPTNFLVFNYLKNLIINTELRKRLESNISRILRYPTFKYKHFYRKENIQKCHRIDSMSLNLMTYKVNEYISIEAEHDHLLSLSLTNLLSSSSGQKYFPKQGLNKTSELYYDTPENRFVKYFFEFIYSTVHKFHMNNATTSTVDEINEILHFCRRILNNKFFKNIGRMQILPTNSPALLNRLGYKEIFAHYRDCRLGVKYIIQDFELELMSIDLKKISDLYEYWVFINITKAFLGQDIFIEQISTLDIDNNIQYKTCMRSGIVSIYYNLTESRAKNTSYSVTFRPDITVIYNKDGREFKFIFDAKYKINQINDDIINAKNEDLYKMHAYMDAINNVELAFVIYPGSEFYFYEKNINTPKRTNIDEIELFKGVGAIPLAPGKSEQLNQLEYLALKLREYIDHL